MGVIHSGTARPARPATMYDLHIAAGFLEGEGSFGRTGGGKGGTERITASQADPERLVWLSAIFGGSVRPHTFRNKAFMGTKYEHLIKPIWRWEVTGPLARGVMFTLFTMLSKWRRAQISDAVRGIAHLRPKYRPALRK